MSLDAIIKVAFQAARRHDHGHEFRGISQIYVIKRPIYDGLQFWNFAQ
jgi:hypothetical protein